MQKFLSIKLVIILFMSLNITSGYSDETIIEKISEEC